MAIAQDKLHPAARAIIDRLTRAPELSRLTPEQARSAPIPLSAAPEPVASVVARGIPGPDGVLPVRIYRPQAATTAALVYFHGGGWVIGSLDSADETCRALANRTPCVVISVGYRLAPETKFPGPVEDAYASLRWVAEHARELGVDPAKIAVGGSSAGGNLAAAAALLARDRGGPAVAFQLLIVPVTDLHWGTRSHEEFSVGYGLTKADMEWFGRHYVRSEADAEDPRASVLRADHHGLPPAFVVTAECDPLRDEGEAYAEALRAAGVRASLVRYPGMPHGFVGFPLDEAKRALGDMAAALGAALR